MPDLQGTLSGKIYDDTSFFSKNMLFGRFSDESKVKNVVLPAFKDYLNEYVKLMDKAVPNTNSNEMSIVKNRQSEYDKYSAIKDPAVGLFDAYFGKEWSNMFVHDFLFSLSRDISNDTDKNNNVYIPPVHNFKINMDTGVVNNIGGQSH